MATPMFALQSVLLPGMPLPLHVFEPRYVAMLDTVVSTDAEMGVVLIERGREVGAAMCGAMSPPWPGWWRRRNWPTAGCW